MPGLKNVVVACPHCRNPVVFLLDMDWIPPRTYLPETIPFEKLSRLAEASPVVARKRKTLVCPSFACGRRFSLLIPRPGGV